MRTLLVTVRDVDEAVDSSRRRMRGHCPAGDGLWAIRHSLRG